MPLLYTPKLLKHCNKKVWTEWMRKGEGAKERRHPLKWNSKVAATAIPAEAAAAAAHDCVCVLKNYIACAVLHNGWIAFLSEISMNMSIIKIIFKAKMTKNANTWDFVKRRNTTAIAYQSIGSTEQRSCWHWQFHLASLPRKWSTWAQIFVSARITHSSPPLSLSSSSFICVCVFIYNVYVCVCVVLYVLFFSHLHTHTSTHTFVVCFFASCLW